MPFVCTYPAYKLTTIAKRGVAWVGSSVQPMEFPNRSEISTRKYRKPPLISYPVYARICGSKGQTIRKVMGGGVGKFRAAGIFCVIKFLA